MTNQEIYEIPLSIFIEVLIAHWICDFIFQSDWMAKNKSSNPLALLSHVLVYSLGMFFILFFTLNLKFIHINMHLTDLFYFIVFNLFLHLITDSITSQFTKYFYKKEQNHWFFVTIGLDQLIHQTCLIITANYILLRDFWSFLDKIK